MGRFEEFTRDGNNFCYIDFSNLQTTEEFMQVIEEGKPIVSKYAESSLYTITNIKNIKFDTAIVRLLTKWMDHNKPHVKSGVVCGVDGMKKIMLNSMSRLTGRKNLTCVFTKEEAIEWLLENL